MKEILYDLRVAHTRFNPVFVIGHGRSGTSILIKLIRKYLKVNFGTESQFIIRYYNNLNKYGSLEKDANVRLLIDDISNERFFKRIKNRFGFELDKEAVFTNLSGRAYADVLESFFRHFATYHRMERWGDKTPEYINHLPALKTLFPDAQFIHIVRDGRDVALSEFKAPFGAKNTFRAAIDWREKIGLFRAFAETLPEDRYIELKYEDLLTRPVRVFERLIAFLCIDDSGNDLIRFIEKHISDDLKSGNFNKWKQQFRPAQKKMFERVAGNLLKIYNYQTEFNIDSPVYLLEKIYWNIDNEVKKHARIDYWQDNLYKLQLRSRSLLVDLRRQNFSA